MSQDVITFEKGLFPQTGQNIKIPGTYLDALNMIRDEVGNLHNELGTVLVESMSAGYEIVGVANLGDDIIIASTNNDSSEIGVLNIDDSYTRSLNSEVFKFKKGSTVELETRFNHRGDRLVYIAGKDIKLRVLNLDKLPAVSVDKETNLFLEYILPEARLDRVFTGGNVLSGVYQFAARLVTESNNNSSFGPSTGLIPIGTGSLNGDRKDYDGADPQTLTSSAISVTLKNIDPSFKFIEPCVITYIGEGNTIKINALERIPIDNKTEVSFTYIGEESEEAPILETEIDIDSTNYEYGNHISQKDNTLIVSGLSEEVNNVKWQDVANGITLKYIEHKLPYKESINVTNNNTPFVGNISIGADNDNDFWVDEAAGGTQEDYKNPKVCSLFKSYKRNEVYSFTFTPIFTSGRHGDAFHIPAKYSSDPRVLRVAEAEGSFYPNSNFEGLAGKKVRYHRFPTNETSPFYKKEGSNEFIIPLGVEVIMPQGDWVEEISGYIIGRESRKGKETLINQGLLRSIYKVGYGNNSYSPSLGCGNTYVSGFPNSNRPNNTVDHKTIFTYHSPDLVTDNKDFIPKNLIRLSRMKGRVEFANFATISIRNHHAASMISCVPESFDIVQRELKEEKTEISSGSIDPLDNSTNLSADGITTPLIGGSVNLLYTRILSAISMESKTPFLINDTGIDRLYRAFTPITQYLPIRSPTPELEAYVDLYEIERSNPSLYGNIYNKESSPIVTVLFDTDTIDFRTNTVIDSMNPVAFGGDIFISRYAYTFKDGMYRPRVKTSCIVYFFVESYNNYNLRHYRDGETIPYYPKYKTLMNFENGLLDIPVASGHSELYNKQYSAENNLQKNYTGSVDQEIITKFDNRVIYSETSIEGERFDAYRLFLPGNYHDIPKQYGKITSSFVHGNDLYFHTERNLWRSFYNNLATQATSEGDIVLGNGGAFPRPSVPILTQNGGYAGCLNYEASIGTPLGRFFYDSNNAKLYFLTEGLQEISNPAVFELLRKNAHKKEVVLGYDTGRKRVLVSAPNFTISYKPELNSFESRHSYQFNKFMSRDLDDYLVQSGRVEKYSKNSVGLYFGNKYNSFVKLISLDHINSSKRYTGAEVAVTSTSMDGLNLPFEFIDKFKMYSLERNTGLNNLQVIRDYLEEFESLGSIHVNKVNSKFRFSFPPDIVNDIGVDIHSPYNLLTSASFSDEDRILLPDMIDNHMVIELTINNINKQRIVKINSFIVNFEQNIT